MVEFNTAGEDSMQGAFQSRIFTIGHSNHHADAFLQLLKRYRVNEIVDVRSIPSSGRFPQFKKQALQRLCVSSGIAYRHCPQLGNKGVDGGIAKLLRQPEGQAALLELYEAAQRATPCGGATAFMCAEADWRDCHRQVVAQKLFEEYGIVTLHITRSGLTEPHPQEHVLPAYYGVSPRLSQAAAGNCDCSSKPLVAAYSAGVAERDDADVPGTASSEPGLESVGDARTSSILTPWSADTIAPADPQIAPAAPKTRRWGKNR